MKVSEICRKHGISDATYYNWKSKYGGMEASDLKRMKEMEVELNDHALKLLKNGRNTLSATYKNTWRWGRYFARNETDKSSSVYNGGVHLILDMLPKN